MYDLIFELIWHLWNGTFQHKVITCLSGQADSDPNLSVD